MTYYDVFNDPCLISMSREAYGVYDASDKLWKVVATKEEAETYLTSPWGPFVIKKKAMRTFWMEILPELSALANEAI